MSENEGDDKGMQRQSMDRSDAVLLKEQRIFDRGYNAVRKMAADMVRNGATVADVLFHANQVWHEFKVGAIQGGMVAALTGGMYIDQYDGEITKAVLSGDERYSDGFDEVRAALYAESMLKGAMLTKGGGLTQT